jgi:hypothetical protein
MNKKPITEVSSVRIAIEVSFAVGKLDYGTITVPVGTEVQRHYDERGKWSDWFIKNPKALCPDTFKINDEVPENGFFMHDAEHYGISIPHANVYGSKNFALKVHKSHHI